MLSAENLHVDVGARTVLRGVSLEAGPGELHVIVGPNGAGKSTLLNTLMGLSRCHVRKGRIIFKGRDVTREPLYRRARMGLALAHQIPPGLRGLTLRELVSAMERLYGSAREVEWAAEILDVKEFMDRPLFTGMSGGERKRVELYLTVLQRPQVALLDEPDSGVDIDTLERIERLLIELRRRGVTVILVSHTLYMLEKLAGHGAIDRVHVLLEGRVAASGPPGPLLHALREGGFHGLAATAG
ncbi:hypothetical protein CF15_08040 [Pyrodictium occultum]|uniref:ABC transporter domain-containing protein n=1 Tax=Pyrodictium occultum TaxID=2309 RepID=A0A0V8RRI0_PYROC|nr:ATP-binding cassette domain-containing protein [Pyrodictium occultum]KSW10725.1 hypothetical protein CF15_08040 [Pyrodictium occultum]